MVKKKTLAPTGPQDENGEHNNAQVSLNADELEMIGLEPGDEVVVEATTSDDHIKLMPADRTRSKPSTF